MTDKVIQELKARIAEAVKNDRNWHDVLGMGTDAAAKEIARAMHLCSTVVQATCSNPKVGVVASAFFYLSMVEQWTANDDLSSKDLAMQLLDKLTPLKDGK
jgi:hypothetical protein